MKWYEQNEKAGTFLLKITFILVSYMPNFVLAPIALLVSFCYYVMCPKQRANIDEYKRNLSLKFNIKKTSSFLNFYNFSYMIIDKIRVWIGKISFEDLKFIDKNSMEKAFCSSKRGKIVITSHFGNVDIARALSSFHNGINMAILMYNQNSTKFANLINKISKIQIKIVEVNDLNIQTMLKLSNFLDSGGFICLMVDRIPIHGNKIHYCDFLGKTAPFPQGAFILSRLLKCDLLALWCIKYKGKYNISVDEIKFDTNITKNMEIYVKKLENMCKKYPNMWFNFFDFWEDKNEK